MHFPYKAYLDSNEPRLRGFRPGSTYINWDVQPGKMDRGLKLQIVLAM